MRARTSGIRSFISPTPIRTGGTRPILQALLMPLPPFPPRHQACREAQRPIRRYPYGALIPVVGGDCANAAERTPASVCAPCPALRDLWQRDDTTGQPPKGRRTQGRWLGDWPCPDRRRCGQISHRSRVKGENPSYQPKPQPELRRQHRSSTRCPRNRQAPGIAEPIIVRVSIRSRWGLGCRDSRHHVPGWYCLDDRHCEP